MWNGIKDSLHNLIFEDARVWYDRNPGFIESTLAWLRLLLAVLMVLMFILMGGANFQGVHARETAIQVRAISPLLHLVPLDWITFVIYIFTWDNLRYAFPVIGAMVCILIAGAYYVKDIYNLRHVLDAMRYVVSSMFGIDYPEINIDHGEKEISRKEVNLVDAIGGPGYAQIQPGNAVLFRKLRKVSRNIITKSVLMTRFETINTITNLDDQDGHVEEMQTVTRDGIQIKVRDIRFRFRIISETVGGKPVPRSTENPYPFSRDAFINMSYNLAVNESGQVSWGSAVKSQVLGVIEDYINAHTIDYLTAPRSHQRDPRQEIREKMFGPGPTTGLRNIGTQLQWVDIGHFDIIVEDVDNERINLWAAEWVGDAEIKKAYLEARRLTYQELGRAEGQAEMLVGIGQALENIDMDENRGQNVRQVLLARVAQILEAMHDNRLESDNSGGSEKSTR